MKTFRLPIATIICVLLSNPFLRGQCFADPPNKVVNFLGQHCVNSIFIAVPSLRITPDARSAGMGNAGIAIGADANALHFNASKLAFAEKGAGGSLSYTPWLQGAENVEDAFMIHGTAFKKLKEGQAVGLGLHYFRLPINGELVVGEWALSAAFAQKIGTHFGLGLTAKYIRSNFPSAFTDVDHGEAIAFDISMNYNKNDWAFGVAITNIGNKITYINDTNKDFLPTNLGIGTAYDINLDDNNRLTVAVDINKLLVPTPDPLAFVDADGNGIADGDLNENGIPDYQEVSVFEGMINSFGDAPGGFDEEWSEINFSLGVEYWFKQTVAVRSGYFHEPRTKGGRQYVTVGVGGQWQSMGLHLSYLIPTMPSADILTNTFRISVLYDFEESI